MRQICYMCFKKGKLYLMSKYINNIRFWHLYCPKSYREWMVVNLCIYAACWEWRRKGGTKWHGFVGPPAVRSSESKDRKPQVKSESICWPASHSSNIAIDLRWRISCKGKKWAETRKCLSLQRIWPRREGLQPAKEQGLYKAKLF